MPTPYPAWSLWRHGVDANDNAGIFDPDDLTTDLVRVFLGAIKIYQAIIARFNVWT